MIVIQLKWSHQREWLCCWESPQPLYPLVWAEHHQGPPSTPQQRGDTPPSRQAASPQPHPSRLWPEGPKIILLYRKKNQIEFYLFIVLRLKTWTSMIWASSVESRSKIFYPPLFSIPGHSGAGPFTSSQQHCICIRVWYCTCGTVIMSRLSDKRPQSYAVLCCIGNDDVTPLSLSMASDVWSDQSPPMR